MRSPFDLVIVKEGQPMHRITDRIYIAGLAEAGNEHFIKGNDIASILTLCEELPEQHATIVHVPFPDTMDATDNDIIKAVLTLHDLHTMTGGHILVHCHAGISRSPMVVAVFLALKNSWSFKKALEYVERGRPVAWPNPSFKRRGPRLVQQLRTWPACVMPGCRMPSLPGPAPMCVGCTRADAAAGYNNRKRRTAPENPKP